MIWPLIDSSSYRYSSYLPHDKSALFFMVFTSCQSTCVWLPPLCIPSLSASDCSDFLRGGLATVWPGSFCLSPSRHCWVHSHRHPAADSRLAHPLALCTYEQSTICRRQRKRQEEVLVPGFTGKTHTHRIPFKSETGGNTCESAIRLYERLEECFRCVQQKLNVYLHGGEHTVDLL